MSDEMLPYIGQVARQARQGAGISQEAMAERLGVERSAVGQFERGRQPRHLDHTLSVYAAAACMHPVDLLARAVALVVADRPMPLQAD
jgi:transcriptional regulator with XRE-family HTH domain